MNFHFNATEHKYYVNGQRVPSVTQVLEREQDFSGVPPETLEAARDFGIHVHEACALLLRKNLNWGSLDLSLVPFVEAANRFLVEEKVIPLMVEERLADPDLKVAGTLDIYGLWRGDEWIFDWKSASAMPRTTALQTAGYDHLLRKNHGGKKRKRAGVQLKDDGTYRIYPYLDPRDINWFMSALNLWHWRNMKDSSPMALMSR